MFQQYGTAWLLHRETLLRVVDHDLANLHCAETDMRNVERELDRFVIVGGFDDVKPGHHLGRLAKWTFGHAHAVTLCPDDPSRVPHQSRAVYDEGFVPPGEIFLDLLLHLFRTQLLPGFTVIA